MLGEEKQFRLVTTGYDVINVTNSDNPRESNAT